MPDTPEADTRSRPDRRTQLIRLGLFVALFFALHRGYALADGSALERWIIESATVQAGVELLNFFWPELAVRAEGTRLVSAQARLNVLNGCEGTDVLFLLLAGIAVAPVSWRWRGIGLLMGLPLVFVLNQARLLALFHALQTDVALFSLLHGTVAPLLLVAAVGLFFAAWLGRAPPLATAS